MSEINKTLVEINKTVIDWLKFAEAKNAGLLTGNLAIIFGITKIDVIAKASLWTIAGAYYSSILFFCFLSSLLCLLSIVPQINIPYLFKTAGHEKNKDLIFYGHIATHTPESYSKALQAALEEKFNTVDECLAGQIVINSRITMRKFQNFKWAAWLTLSAFFTPIIGGWLLLIREK